jgi:hypothetical protein
MGANVGGVDKVMRIVLGVLFLGAAIGHFITGRLAIAAYVVGGIALVTGLFSFCPAWAIFGINTCSVRHARSK